MYKDDKILDEYPRAFWEDAIRQWVRDEKARYCIIRNFLDDVPYEEIAAEINVTYSTVFRKIKKYHKILFEHINDT